MNPESKLFILDYDGTYTADPELWNAFIASAKTRGHRFIVATMRHPEEGAEVEASLKSQVEKIIYTGRKAKFDEVMRQGYTAGIWIDDQPHFLFYGG